MQKKNIEPDSVIRDYFKYVEQYRCASYCLSLAENTLFPNQHVRGLLIELTLKTYLCACGQISWGHDLKALTDEAIEYDLVLNEEDHENVISNTNDLYYRGGAWDSDYLCRYPMSNRGTLVTITPTHKMVDDMIGRIICQAKTKNEARNK